MTVSLNQFQILATHKSKQATSLRSSRVLSQQLFQSTQEGLSWLPAAQIHWERIILQTNPTKELHFLLPNWNSHPLLFTFSSWTQLASPLRWEWSGGEVTSTASHFLSEHLLIPLHISTSLQSYVDLSNLCNVKWNVWNPIILLMSPNINWYDTIMKRLTVRRQI